MENKVRRTAQRPILGEVAFLLLPQAQGDHCLLGNLIFCDPTGLLALYKGTGPRCFPGKAMCNYQESTLTLKIQCLAPSAQFNKAGPQTWRDAEATAD